MDLGDDLTGLPINNPSLSFLTENSAKSKHPYPDLRLFNQKWEQITSYLRLYVCGTEEAE